MLRSSLLFVVLALVIASSLAVTPVTRHYRFANLKQQEQEEAPKQIDAPPVWNIDASKPLVSVSPDLFGIFFEEINHAGHGGLYGNLVHNSNFEDKRSIVWPWKATGTGITLAITNRYPMNAYSPNALNVLVAAGTNNKASTVGIINPGFWGVNAVAGAAFRVSFWATSRTVSSLTVAIQSEDGSKVYASNQVTGIEGRWMKHNVSDLLIPVGVNDPKSVIAFTWDGSSSAQDITFDVVTAFMNTGWKGLLYVRKDLGDYLDAMHPSFVRFPGGCYAEGDDLVNRFNWKTALGPVEERAGHWNLWGYWSEDGLGLFEYLSIIDKLTDAFGNPTRAIWVVNNGISHGQSLSPEQVLPYLQDAMDSLEFAMGDAHTTYWGSMRARMGHSEPFIISYMAIGNEDCGKPYYAENYELFYDAISAKYPAIKLISNCSPQDIKGYPVQVWDYHIYASADVIAQGASTFNDKSWRSTGSKIFNSEYAVTTGAGRGNLIAALAEAAWMTGLERNSDVVTTASYAPLFVNDNDRTWSPDAIVFNAAAAYGTPSYHNQVIWANSFSGILNGTVQTLSYTLDAGLRNVVVAVAVGQANAQLQADKAANIVLVHKLVNVKGQEQPLTISLSGMPSSAKLNPILDVTALLGANSSDENTFVSPHSIIPSISTLNVTGPIFNVTLPPWSVLVVRAYASV